MLVDKNGPHLRCPVCDYQWKPVGGTQSSFFNSLPKEEKNKNRYTVKHHRTNEVVLGCADCYGFEMTEKRRPTRKELEKLADAILKEDDSTSCDKVPHCNTP